MKDKPKKQTKRENIEEVKKGESKESIEKRMTLYAYIILGLIVAVILGVIIYLIWNQMNSQFNYQGMEFKRVVKNNEIVYSTAFITKSMINGTFYINNRTFYLKNNPKYLWLDKKIEGKLPIITNREVYVSIDEPLENCNDRVRSLFDLSASLVNYGLQVKGAVVNQTKANQNYPEITCLNSTSNTVIIITKGDYTGFQEIKPNCYEISFEKCDDMNKATEGFTLKLLERMADNLGLNKK
jgi:hypothetical protein